MREVDVVVAGGGSNVVSLAAALYTIARQRKVCRVAGTSAGGLSALAFAFGVDETRLLRQFEGSLNGDRLLDGSVLGIARGFGWCKGDALRAAARVLVGEGKRLGDAKLPVAVVVADLYERRPRVLSSWATPDVLAEDAAVATAAIPLVFRAQTIRGLGVGNRLHVDGGTVKNAAFDIFDDIPERPTIGIRPRPSSTTATPVRSIGDYVKAMGALLLWSADNAHASAKASGAVVDVDAEDGLDFNLSVEDVRRRWGRGVLAGSSFLRGAP